MNTASSNQPGYLEKPKPAINEPPSTAARKEQQIPHQIRKEIEDIEKNLEALKEEEQTSEKEIVQIWWNLFQKYENEDNIGSIIGDLLVKHNFFDVMVNIWDHCHSTDNLEDSYLISTSYYQMKLICCYVSDVCVNFCQESFRHRLMFERFMKELTLPELSVEKLYDEKKRQQIEATLHFLHNTVRLHSPNRELVHQNDGIRRLLSYHDSECITIKALVTIVLTYCTDEEQNDKIIGKEVIDFLMKILKDALKHPDHNSSRSWGNFSASEIVCGFNMLALNDNNKVSMVDEGVLFHLTEMLTGNKFPDEHALAAECLWSLSFHPQNKDRIKKEHGLMDAVHGLFKNPKSDEDTRKSCENILFLLADKVTSDASPSASATSATKKQHIMISYQWDAKSTIRKVNDILTNNGFNVWLDEHDMQGSILQAMADAVENASVVVICVSEKYKNSNSCRTEAEYAYKLSKPIAPLLLEPQYTANGWLGALLGMEKYVEVSSEDDLDAKKVDEIVKMIRSKVGDQIVESEIAKTASPPEGAPSDTAVDGPSNSKLLTKLSTNDVNRSTEEAGDAKTASPPEGAPSDTAVDGPSSSKLLTKLSTNDVNRSTEEAGDVNKCFSYLTGLSETVTDGPASSKSFNKWSVNDVSKWAEETRIAKTASPPEGAPSDTAVDGPSSSKLLTKLSTNDVNRSTEEAGDVNKCSSYLTGLSETVTDGPASSKSFNKWSVNDVSKWAEETRIERLLSQDLPLGGEMRDKQMQAKTASPPEGAPSDTAVDGPSSSKLQTKLSTKDLNRSTEEAGDVNKCSSYLTGLSETVTDGPASSKSFNKWSVNDVSKWAEETRIDGLPLLLACADGVVLEQLIQLLKRSPDIYYNSLRVDLKLSFIQSLQFTHCLEKL